MIALYMRLSRADGDLEGEGAVSNSIANQRAILRSFVERDPGLSCQPVEEFVDDGFSGSSFMLPAFRFYSTHILTILLTMVVRMVRIELNRGGGRGSLA